MWGYEASHCACSYGPKNPGKGRLLHNFGLWVSVSLVSRLLSVFEKTKRSLGTRLVVGHAREMQPYHNLRFARGNSHIPKTHVASKIPAICGTCCIMHMLCIFHRV